MKNTIRISLRNLFIVIIVLLLMVCSAELIIKSNMPINPSQVKVNSLYFNYEKSTIEDLSSTMMTRSVYGLPELNSNKSVYPLVKLSSENDYDDNTVNIVVIGDSFVWGYESLNRNELFWSLLEKDLRKKGYNCRVYGIGMAGANAFEELDWLTKSSLVEDLNPDIVIFGYVTNDWFSGEKGFNPGFMTRSSPVLSLVRRFTPNIFSVISFLPTSKSAKEGEEKFVIPLNEYAKSVDFPIVYMTLPNFPNIPDFFYKPLHKVYSKYTNVAFYDCLYDFSHNFASEKHSDNYTVNPTDAHPGSATNRFYADYILDFLEKDYGDIIGKSAEINLNNQNININEYLPLRLNLNEENRTENTVVYSLDYPSEINKYSWKAGKINHTFDKYLLNYPLEKDHIKLSFAYPVDISEIQITGDNVENIDLYYTKINKELNYDDHTVIPFGKKSSDGTVWTDSTSDLVTSLCIHADCINNDGSKLQIKISKTES